MTRAFITGVTGMVGSHLVDYLLAHTDWQLFGFCRWNESMDNLEHLMPLLNEGSRLQLLYGDLNDYSSVATSIETAAPDYVFHLAAQSYPQTSFIAPLETLQTNIIGTAILLECVRHSAYRNAVIHICSSSEVFGRVSQDQLPIDETCTFHPASPYAISKVGTDLLGRYYAEGYGMTTLTTRMFTHTGPRRGDVFAESSFAKQIALIEKGQQEPILYVGNLQSLRTYADVRDAVRAYYLLVTHNPIAGAYYNIGGNHTCTVGEMLDYLLSQSTMGETIRVVTDPNRLRPIDADLQVPDTHLFQSHTGWRPCITFEDTMTDLLSYWRDRVNTGRCFLRR
ncbi:SDR family oxidoreductase [bacterium]|nr:SDR family oxidoreductase [bacterium]